MFGFSLFHDCSSIEGCRACAATDSTSLFANYMLATVKCVQKDNFMRHQRSCKAHQRAVANDGCSSIVCALNGKCWGIIDGMYFKLFRTFQTFWPNNWTSKVHHLAKIFLTSSEVRWGEAKMQCARGKSVQRCGGLELNNFATYLFAFVSTVKTKINCEATI